MLRTYYMTPLLMLVDISRMVTSLWFIHITIKSVFTILLLVLSQVCNEWCTGVCVTFSDPASERMSLYVLTHTQIGTHRLQVYSFIWKNSKHFPLITCVTNSYIFHISCNVGMTQQIFGASVVSLSSSWWLRRDGDGEAEGEGLSLGQLSPSPPLPSGTAHLVAAPAPI